MKKRPHIWKRPSGKFSKLQRLRGRLGHDRIIELYQRGHSVRLIAAEDGTSKTVICRILQRAGVVLRASHAPKRYSYCDLAKKVGCAPCTALRFQVIFTLGGTCCKCGEDDLRVLQINHTNGKRRKLTISEMQKILTGQFKNVDVRCSNCNVRYEYERGFRPWFSALNQYLALPKNG